MRELPKEFYGKGQVKGYYFKQLVAEPYGYIYEVINGHRLHYEVFKRRENERFGVVSYPTDKSFGKWAWTLSFLDSAKKRLDKLKEDYIRNLEVNI